MQTIFTFVCYQNKGSNWSLYFLYLKLKYEKNQFKIDVLNSIDNVNYQKHIHYDKLENYYLSSFQTVKRSSKQIT